MAGRIRSIKPEILEDEKTAALTHLEWRLFVSLWLIADDHGNLRGDPVYVQGQTLWAARTTSDEVSTSLSSLAMSGLLVHYTVRGQTYYHITGWSKHQKVDKPGRPRMPGPDQSDSVSSQPHREIPETLAKSSRDPRETLATDLRPPTSDLRPPTEGSPSARAIPPTGVGVAQAPSPTPTPADPKLDQIVQSVTEVVHAPTTRTVDQSATPERDLVQYDHENPRARGQLAEATYQRVSDARIARAVELKLPDQLPFPAITPATRPRGFTELIDRVREEGPSAPAACDRVVASLIAQARETRGPTALEWLSLKAFSAGAWATARERVPGAAREIAARSAQRTKPEGPPAAPRASESPPPAQVSPADREAALAELEHSKSLLGIGPRAPPASAPSTADPDHQQRRRKAT